MYTFQFMDGTWRIDLMTSSKERYPAYGTVAHPLFEGAYNSQREANEAIQLIRTLTRKD